MQIVIEAKGVLLNNKMDEDCEVEKRVVKVNECAEGLNNIMEQRREKGKRQNVQNQNRTMYRYYIGKECAAQNLWEEED